MASNRKEHPMLVTFEHLPTAKERWNACVNAVHKDYKLTIKQMCKALKCNRSWVNRYVKPHVHYIYLTGYGTVTNYLRAAGVEGTETTRYSSKDFNSLIKTNITQITRQTILVPIEKFIRPDKMNYFLQNYISIDGIMDILTTLTDEEQQEKKINFLKLMQERAELIKECATDIGLELWLDAPAKGERTKSIPVSCSVNFANLDIQKDFLAVHDLKDYGDNDEEIYRDLFCRGCYKIVLEIPDAAGNLSQKIYYIDPVWEQEGVHTREFILVKYKTYIKLFGE